MADRETTPVLSCDLFYTKSMCMCVNVYACMFVCVCVCVCVFVCMYHMSRMRVRIFQLFQFQVSHRMNNGMCVYDCVRACDCV